MPWAANPPTSNREILPLEASMSLDLRCSPVQSPLWASICLTQSLLFAGEKHWSILEKQEQLPFMRDDHFLISKAINLRADMSGCVSSPLCYNSLGRQKNEKGEIKKGKGDGYNWSCPIGGCLFEGGRFGVFILNLHLDCLKGCIVCRLEDALFFVFLSPCCIPSVQCRLCLCDDEWVCRENGCRGTKVNMLVVYWSGYVSQMASYSLLSALYKEYDAIWDATLVFEAEKTILQMFIYCQIYCSFDLVANHTGVLLDQL